MSSPSAGPPLEVIADDGSTLALYDVVDGCHADLAEVMASLHRLAFPDHLFAADEILDDATRPSRRDHLVAHQWLLTRDGEPVGYSLADTNLRRRVAPIHFLAVEPTARSITVGGVGIGGWFLRDSLRQYEADAGEPGLGCVAETPRYKLPIFHRYGWRVFDVPYREPIHGWRWPVDGLDTRDVALIWLPPDAGPHRGSEADAARAAAAAFLLDKYRVDPSVDWVHELVNGEAGIS